MAAAKLIQLPTLRLICIQIKLCYSNNNNVGHGYYSHKADKHESRAETI